MDELLQCLMVQAPNKMSSQPLFEIKNLHASIKEEKSSNQAEKPILMGINLCVKMGESHVIMGPNGSGKSTLSNVVLGHPNYIITKGDILLDGESILNWPTEQRARHGLFVSFQYPTAIPGVSIFNFLRRALALKQEYIASASQKGDAIHVNEKKNKEVPLKEFRNNVLEAMKGLEMEPKFLGRFLNDGFSGGEKKRNEILQMKLLEPKLAILDEIDSGLDIDALRLIASQIEEQRNSKRSFIFITHYQRLLDYLTIDHVHVFKGGRIVKSGGVEIARKLELEGYDKIV